MSKRPSCGWIMGMLVAMPLAAGLLYWSWCWGWWGRENRLMHYLFQCQCPLASAEARYPDNVDVLVPACLGPYSSTIASGLATSPSGRYTYFSIRYPDAQGYVSPRSYLYDRNLDRFTEIDKGRGFLTDDLVVGVEGAEDYYLYTVDGKRLIKLNRIVMTENNTFDSLTLDILRKAEKIYVVTRWLAVALGSDFQQNSQSNLAIEMTRHSDYAHLHETIANPLEDNGVRFEVVSKGADVLLPTPDVYLIGGEPPSPGVGQVYQPLLRLRVPLQELDPSARPRVEAQRAQEITDKRNANVALVIGLVALVALLGITAFGVFRSTLGQRPRS